MKIVILDALTLNPGDLSWQELKAIGELTVYDRSAHDEVVERAQNADIVLTNKTVLTKELLAQLPKLKYIGVLATGTNVVDLDAAAKLNIPVTNVPAYGPDAVAQMVFAHILHFTQRLSEHANAVRRGRWTKSPDFCFTLYPLMSLKGKTMGLVGFGDIAKQVARIALAFDMKILVHSRTCPADLPSGIGYVDLNTLLGNSDFVSLHCPLTPQTDKLIDAQALDLMKPSSMLINTARGGLVDEQALSLALEQEKIAYAGVDVLSQEPPAADNPLLNAPNISISPHNAWATKEARQNLLNIAVGNINAFIADRIENRVN